MPRRAIIVVLVLALQVLVPLRALLDDSDHQQRFGWSMYSTETLYPEITLELRDGGRQGIGLGGVVLHRRPEVRYDRDLPPFLCSRHPEARAVVLTVAPSAPEVTRCD